MANDCQVEGVLAPPAVLVEGLTFQWPKQDGVLLDIPHFSLQQGEEVFLAGPSGSGKSTFLSLIAGIILPKSGHLSILGHDLAALKSSERDLLRGDHLGIIFQQFNLIPYLSVVENVLLAARFSALRTKRARERFGTVTKQAETLLDELGLERSIWAHPVHQLSVGQQQRVACARALIGFPELIIADEPTSALDHDRRCDFLSLLQSQCRKAGSSLLFVSHDLELAASFPRKEALSAINVAKVAAMQ